MAEIVYDGSINMTMHDYRGLSAYEIAVQNGFKGTEVEWLASLKGEPGKAGDTITVNRKRAVDGNISVNATDINRRAGESESVAEVIDRIEKAQTTGLTADAIVNDLNTGGANKLLSAEMGALLNVRKPELFWARVEAPIGNWEGEGPYTRDITLEGVLADSNACSIMYTPTVENEEAFIDANLRVIAQKTDALTIRVDEIPEAAIPFNVMVTVLKSREVAE
jgi:hypothetical protein